MSPSAPTWASEREALLAVEIPEQPGSFLQLLRGRSAQRSVTEFNYRYDGSEQAQIFVGFAPEPGA